MYGCLECLVHLYEEWIHYYVKVLTEILSVLDTKYIKTYYVLNMMMSRPAEEEEIHTIQINMYINTR